MSKHQEESFQGVKAELLLSQILVARLREDPSEISRDELLELLEKVAKIK